MTFAQRVIDLTFTLGTGSFGDSGANTYNISGLRVKAEITKAGGVVMGEAHLKIYGLPPSVINPLTALTSQIMMQRNNSVIISAGDSIDGMGVVFEGTISEGWADLNTQPDSILQITAFSGLLQKIQPVPPSSYPGTADVAVIMASLATQMGLQFENNGVSVKLWTPYFPGTAVEQVRRAADAANINWIIDDTTLAIWPKGGSRGGAIPVISAETGMVGYPAYNGVGISVTTEFNPTIYFGNTVNVKSDILNANGNWFVYSLKHNLESEVPGGEWFTHFMGAPLYNTFVLPT